MADTNEFIGEAYDTLVKLSADEKKRLEYEAREKAIRDYNAGINYARKQGEEIGKAQGVTIAIQIIADHNKGISNDKIAENRNMSLEDVNQIIMQFKSI
ncbi:MAG: Rpn family recombination-promoting nuclease/putative transposase [Lachnospiraceae bacterium]|nr:Rpn family recombination-promoting nuclease/putative transposase [Lachnospiraceae bacterium]